MAGGGFSFFTPGFAMSARSIRSIRSQPKTKAGGAGDDGEKRGLPRGLLRAGRCALLAAALLGSLAACVERGDFGRPRPSVVNDTILPFVGSFVAASREEAVSSFILTDDERELRDRSWRFLMPAHERSFFELQVAELSRTRILPRTVRIGGISSYFSALRSSSQISPAPLFRRIGEDAAADRALVPPFLALAERVLDADDVRLKLLVHVADITDAQVADAAARVAENRCLIAWVRAEAQARAGRYRHALERLAVEAPQRQAAYAEREVLALEAEVADFALLGIPALEDGFCDARSAHRASAGEERAPAGVFKR